jgi:hypothetical protein
MKYWMAAEAASGARNARGQLQPAQGHAALCAGGPEAAAEAIGIRRPESRGPSPKLMASPALASWGDSGPYRIPIIAPNMVSTAQPQG